MENFSIYENGQLVQPPVYERVGMAAVSHVQAAGAVLLHNLGNVAAEVFTPVILDIHDAQHGSHLREEWFERKHELATAAMRESVGL